MWKTRVNSHSKSKRRKYVVLISITKGNQRTKKVDKARQNHLISKK